MFNQYGMPKTPEETAVYVAVAVVAAYVYGKDKSTNVDLKKIDLTPMQEYQIKSVIELILDILGYKATVEAKPDEPNDSADADKILARLKELEALRDGTGDSGGG